MYMYVYVHIYAGICQVDGIPNCLSLAMAVFRVSESWECSIHKVSTA